MLDLSTQILDWAWARHHNPLSWYIRPIFILPFCWFAWRRSALGVALTLVATLTSIAWFPAPAVPDAAIARYLQLERQWLGDWRIALPMLALVGASLWLLIAAFWMRRWIYGLVVVNLATLVKVAFSVVAGGDAGWTSLPPSLATLGVVNLSALGLWLRRQRRSGA